MMKTVGIRCPQIHNIGTFWQLFSDWWDGRSGCCNYWFRHKGSRLRCLSQVFRFLDCGGGDGGLVVVLGFLMLVVFSRVFIGNLTPENGLTRRRCHHFQGCFDRGICWCWRPCNVAESWPLEWDKFRALRRLWAFLDAICGPSHPLCWS